MHTEFLFRKPDGKRPRLLWEVNNIIKLRELEWKGLEWIRLALDRHHWWTLSNTTMKLRIP